MDVDDPEAKDKWGTIQTHSVILTTLDKNQFYYKIQMDYVP